MRLKVWPLEWISISLSFPFPPAFCAIQALAACRQPQGWVEDAHFAALSGSPVGHKQHQMVQRKELEGPSGYSAPRGPAKPRLRGLLAHCACLP